MDENELVAELQSKAAEYRRKADAFERAAEELASSLLAPNGHVLPAAPSRRLLDRQVPENPAPGRVEQISRFLKHHGPATRGEVISEAGVPAGSVRAVLNRNYFERDDATGRWVRLREDFER